MKLLLAFLAIGYTLAQTCANGLLEGSEACDDGNSVSGDGCTAACAVETGWLCEGGDSTKPDTCNPDAGDNWIVSGVEECDDGNAISGDGCSSSGLVEFSYVCFDNPESGPLNICVKIDESSYIYDTIANMAGFVTYFFVGGALLVTFILNGRASNSAWNILFAT